MPNAKRSSSSPNDVGVRADAPEVIVDFVFDHGVLHVAIVNISDVPAHAVSVDFEPSFRGLGGLTEVSSLALFRKLAFLAPRKRIETLLDSSAAYFSRREPTRIASIVKYRDAAGQRYERRIAHDLSIYKTISYLVQPAISAALPVSATTSARLVPSTPEQSHGRSPR